MFGSKKKERQAAHNAARHQAFHEWFEQLGRARTDGTSALTEGLIAKVGSPFTFLGPAVARDDIPFLTARYYGQEWAARLSRKAILEDDPDARSRSEFWRSVSSWL
jgi:hypothetical protein